MIKQYQKTKRGLTLVETILGVLVFSIIVLTTTGVFVSSFHAKRFAQNAQEKYNLAFGSLGEVGKFLSTSTIMSGNTDMDGDSSIVAYSYSTGECVQFVFDTDSILKKRSRVMALTENYKDCSASYVSASSFVHVGDTFLADGKFIVRKLDRTTSGSEHSGMVTIFAKAYAASPGGGNTERPVVLQTTVSLRDYLVEEEL